ncbi:hypothetical protein HNR42_000433 [Deinobacterium chartae]|uniref:Uncharacterized protein n=1 Tax=Deinobacterium chartae TaxID=521158 RepID=A0A841HXR4_9DEIO|nr:hypothetical protein [Deinobacterium chartae]MBB6097019.1 hypothetical protein [Deinobacterium chartae]
MALQLNLAALTSSELERLLGSDASRQLAATLSSARLAGKPVEGPAVPECFLEGAAEFTAPGDTPDEARRIAELQGELLGAGLEVIGGYRACDLRGPLNLLAFGGGEVAVALRWGETLEPSLLLVSWLREPVAGVSGVLTSTSRAPNILEVSDVLTYRHLPGESAATALEAQRLGVRQYGRAQKVASRGDLEALLENLWRADLAALRRRGALIETSR